jgi:hypothetical protein
MIDKLYDVYWTDTRNNNERCSEKGGLTREEAERMIAEWAREAPFFVDCVILPHNSKEEHA